ncbi:TonB-dependent receptor [Flectobacillus longus]|uniref:TonB-dependent receptor n=1 Tax=Flectobacillus longus TaxID=2984207 RepID=UPI0024B6EB0D|nr:carboxypeptidase-like regulatory domain-containing protein [Flectobacillus longus]MDI9879244.1 carboxypeptidase-like regulatory domain-containing protein [Flectobacillus longus]
MKKHILTIFIFISTLAQTIAQVATVTGKITDAQTQKPIQGVTIRVKGKLAGTQTNANGSFSISLKTPASIVVTMIGYEAKAIDIANNQAIDISLSPANSELDPVVVTASRVEERILRSPVSIEKMDIRQVQQTPSANYYDGLQNIKSLDMVTSSLTYKQINTRGFNSTGNGRFLQLVDGIDNQPAGLGFAMGNLFGPHDLDVESAELIAGAASALYGPIAFNGLLNTRTKNPFDFQGLSIQTKFGLNHVGDGTGLGAKPMSDLALRYAKVF